LIWAALDLGMMVAIIFALPMLAGVRWTDPRAAALAAGVIALGPLRNGAMGGQLAIVVGGLVALAVVVAQRGRAWTPGVLPAVACALKPPLAGPFVLYDALRRRWWLVVTAGVVAAVILLIGIARLQASGVAWLPELRDNVRAAAAPGAINDATAWSIKRFEMIHLSVLLHAFSDNRRIVAALNIALVGAVAGLFARTVWLRRRDGDERRALAELALVSVCTLLPLYHRWYDAGLLVFVLAWGAAAWPTRWRTEACAAALAVMASFIVSPALWFVKKLPHAASPPFRYRPRFEQLILPVQVWTLVLLCAMLLYVLHDDDEEQAPAIARGGDGD
jgi:hypothetical protein